ncbi:MAG: hypothetical protein ACRDY6_07110 [Acidimicrobiia bacterium]
MNLRINDPALRAEFARHFERAGFTVESRHDGILVKRPDAPDPAQARREIVAHAQIWELMHPEARVEQLD